jgi:hypothetical protein
LNTFSPSSFMDSKATNARLKKNNSPGPWMYLFLSFSLFETLTFQIFCEICILFKSSFWQAS